MGVIAITERYEIGGILGEGGMGVVYEGFDRLLGRPVAIKLLRGPIADREDLAERFEEEARVAAQLEHPGIVTVYDRGRTSNGRLYMVMKLVRGRDFDELLNSDSCGLEDRLSIFERVSRAVGYAHERKVIHRDLKPRNIRVDESGNAVVMDWGLVKVLRRGTAIDAIEGGDDPGGIRSGRTEVPGSETQAGSVAGTYGYMAPEQAWGEVGKIDARSDVFALGAILFQIVTGQPLYPGTTREEILGQARRADPARVLEELRRYSVGPDLTRLAQRCLARRPEDRPQDAGEVAGGIRAYIEGAVAARAKAEARAIERRRRRLLVAALASMVVLGLAVVGNRLWRQSIRNRNAVPMLERVEERLATSEELPWNEISAEVSRVRSLLGPDGDTGLLRRADAIDARLDRDRRLSERLTEIRIGRVSEQIGKGEPGDYEPGNYRSRTRTAELADTGGCWFSSDRYPKADYRRGVIEAHSGRDIDSAYRKAFLGEGIDVDRLPTPRAAELIRTRSRAVVAALATALDHWALLRRWELRDANWQRLVALARAINHDGWCDSLRATLGEKDAERCRRAVLELAADPKVAGLPARSIQLLGVALVGVGEPRRAIEVLREARRHFPGDFWINYNLAWYLDRKVSPRQREEAIRYYTVAQAIRPDSAHQLAHALEDRGRIEEAVAILHDLTLRRPRSSRHLACLGGALVAAGDARAAAEAFGRAEAAAREAIAREPSSGTAYVDLGIALEGQGAYPATVAAFRESIRLGPESPEKHQRLANALMRDGHLDQAAAACRAAIKLDPNDPEYRLDLGALLCDRLRDFRGAIEQFQVAARLAPDDLRPRHNLGLALWYLGKTEEAKSSFRHAISLDPGDGPAHLELGALLLEAKPDDAEAIDELRKAARLLPREARAYSLLGRALAASRLYRDAIAAARTARDLEPGRAGYHLDLGALLCDRAHDYPGAVTEFREAIRLEPGDYRGYANLGIALGGLGQDAEAADVTETAIGFCPATADPRLRARLQADLGITLSAAKRREGAIAAFRRAIDLDPMDPTHHFRLGFELRYMGRFPESLAEFRRCQDLNAKRPNPDRRTSAWVGEARRLIEISERLPMILGGDRAPSVDPLLIARACAAKGRYAEAARFYADALAAGPSGHKHLRLDAACAAALAAAGPGAECPPSDGPDRRRLLHQALAWLKDDLDAWAGRLTADPKHGPHQVRQALQRWKDDPELAVLRDDKELARWPEQDRAACRGLWAEIERLLERSKDKIPS
jgi:serine/threonine-protein kinase